MLMFILRSNSFLAHICATAMSVYSRYEDINVFRFFPVIKVINESPQKTLDGCDENRWSWR